MAGTGVRDADEKRRRTTLFGCTFREVGSSTASFCQTLGIKLVSFQMRRSGALIARKVSEHSSKSANEAVARATGPRLLTSAQKTHFEERERRLMTTIFRWINLPVLPLVISFWFSQRLIKPSHAQFEILMRLSPCHVSFPSVRNISRRAQPTVLVLLSHATVSPQIDISEMVCQEPRSRVKMPLEENRLVDVMINIILCDCLTVRLGR